MPKKVDHEERRRVIADAVLRLLSEDGVEGTTLRTVALGAGVSMGAVQHYFKTKEEMFLFALTRANERLAARIQDQLATGPAPSSARAGFRFFLTQLLPLDEESRTGARVWIAFLSRAATDPATRALAAAAYTNLTGFIRTHLAKAHADAETLEDLDLDRAAHSLVATIEGLRYPLLLGARSPGESLAVLDKQLDQIFRPSR